MNWPKSVTIKEVGPRDGLQNEKLILSTSDKIAWIDRLSYTGLTYLEITSFVHPKWIPQLADAVEVAQNINRNPSVTYAALVPNMKGLESALSCSVDEVSVFISASETHNKQNINKTISETFPILQEVIAAAINEGKTVRGYISTVFGCPYEGDVDYNQAFRICEKLFTMGISEISLGDTIGVASPRQVEDFLNQALKLYQPQSFAMHFHDTRGMALANIVKALDYGISTFDSSLGGLGGCPYAPGASGNVATDDLVHMFEKMNIHTGVNEGALVDSALFVQKKINKPLPSHRMAMYSHSKG
ncbi:hydroxymethylglutaryl-CoA lyase [Peribacillus loiseleuriae]|uniref:Hydroxymethylglutaryl-CoA lyase n=1 Tax=Peribacillus loiseleuriae TaxID=1679170 RepID=A0A0K9GUE6_9BACI|nr:hydroxymethylglutaryl-CoA lyase [Peribacillus loiseleuriae]KMY49867.1 hydroxymethylglutaryl-CoA lyase [Peribacillus loiseleuriae]